MCLSGFSDIFLEALYYLHMPLRVSYSYLILEGNMVVLGAAKDWPMFHKTLQFTFLILLMTLSWSNTFNLTSCVMFWYRITSVYESELKYEDRPRNTISRWNC